MYRTHDEMRDDLRGTVGHNIIRQLCHHYLPYTRHIPDRALVFRVYSEVTLRERGNGEMNRYGGEKPDHYRLDAVMTVMPGRDSLNQDKTFIVGIELKGSIEGLRADHKFSHYRGWVNLLFFGVPKELIPAALEKTERYDDIGVIDIENGYIWKYPTWTNPEVDRQNELLKQLIFNYM